MEGGQASYVFETLTPSLLLYFSTYTLDDWKGHRILGPPKKSADNCDAAVILTGLHWHGTGTDTKLITTYRHHGIQCVFLADIPY